MLIHETGYNRFWTGNSRDITEKQGIPRGWFAGDMPKLSEGQSARWVGRSWLLVDAPAPVEPKYQNVEDAKAAVLGFIDDFTAQFTGGASAAEPISWGVKAAAARAHTAGTATAEQTAMLQAEAEITGETLDDLADKISAQAVVYATVIGKVTGLRRKTYAALEAVTDPAQYEVVIDAAKAEADALAAALGL